MGRKEIRNVESHLLQMRGLKPSKTSALAPVAVASFTDAWIETLNTVCVNLGTVVASFTDAWIETLNNRFCPSSLGGRIFYRCVD